MLTLYRLVLLTFLLILPAVSFAVVKGAEQELRPLTFSLIPKKDVDQQLAELQPLLQLLEKRLQRSIRVVRPNSYQSVIEGLLAHKIDFGFLGPASYAYARARDKEVDAFACFSLKESYITPAGSYYHSVLFTVKKAGFTRSSQLEGKTVAMTDPASTSGFLIPAVEFGRQIGMPLNEFFAKQVYAGSHDRAIEAVLRGQVDAAFVASVRVDEAIREGQVEFEEVALLWQSLPIHRDPFVFGSSLNTELREQIREAVLSASPELQGMFRKMGIDGIVAVTDADYQTIHEIAARRREL